MRHTCHFLDLLLLPYDLLGIIFAYLRIEEVGKLDSVISDECSRMVLLDALRKYTFARIVDQLDMSCLDWLNKRGARMSELILRSPNIKCDALIQIIERCPDIKHLNAGSYCNDLVLMTLARYCRDLRSFKVDLARNPLCAELGEIVTVTGIRSLLLSSPLLECCRIDHARAITSSDLNQIAQATSMCTNLKELSFSHCSPFPTEGLLSIAWNCRQLRSLAFDCGGDVNIVKFCNVLSVQAHSLRSLKFAAMRCADYLGQVSQAVRFVRISHDGIKICTHPLTRHYDSSDYDSSERITVAQSPPSREISVIDLNGDTRALLQVQPVDTVMTIQRQICEQTGIRPDQQRLVDCGRVLRPTEMLTDHSSITLFVKSIKVRQLFRFKRFF